MRVASRSQFDMTAADVCEYFAASREWLRLRILKSDFPKPVRLSGRLSHRRWSLADIQTWEAERVSAEPRPAAAIERVAP